MSKRVENPEFQGVRMRIVKRVVFVLLLFSTFAMAKTKLILDTDTGFSHPYDKGHMDDASTILMLLKSEQVELLGITEVSGNEWVDQGVQNALKLLEIAGREEVPVFRGALYPMVHDVERFDSIEKYATGYTWRGALNPWHKGPSHIVRPMGELPTLKPREQNAVQFLLDTVSRNPGEITILAIGPLTNLALAMGIDETFASKIKHIVIMGGAFYTGGNANGAAEFNFWWDPEAARKVMRSGARISLVPLDVCHKTKYKKWQYERILDSGNRNSRFFEAVDGPFWKSNPTELLTVFDAVAAAYLLRPEIFPDVRRRFVDVEVGQALSYGQSIAFRNEDRWEGRLDFRPPLGTSEVDIVFDVDTKEYDELFASLLASAD